MPTLWPKPFKYFANVRFFLISLCIIIVLIVAAIFSFIYNRTNELMLQRLKEQAATYYDLIRQTKMWNYGYGGVYVEKKGEISANTYLKSLGVNPDVQCKTGQLFTIRNHAIMIKEISRLTEGENGVKFRIVANNPIDPDNTPDKIEKEALQKFVQGGKEAWEMEAQPSAPPVFRYIRPMYEEESCKECHKQSASYGSVIGAVSITIPMAALHDETDITKILIIISAVITIGLLVVITYFLTWRLVINLDEAQVRLKKLASTDELTSLKNRRTIMQDLEEEFERAERQQGKFCIIVLDIDHFKLINDSFGHPFGDLVLQNVSICIKETLRRYDSVGRIGGEEFLVISPGSDLSDAITLAERILLHIRELEVNEDDKAVRVTVSAGAALYMPGDKGVQDLLKRADGALYRAKEEGRNRVVAAG
jgi:diguanylate cyclase (GGDEF)-like protein